MFIESVFEMVQKVARFILSPTEAGNKVYSWLYPTHGNGNGNDEGSDSDTEIPIPTATVGSKDPMPTKTHISFPNYLNTDSRTCQDVITELGLAILLLSFYLTSVIFTNILLSSWGLSALNTLPIYIHTHLVLQVPI